MRARRTRAAVVVVLCAARIASAQEHTGSAPLPVVAAPPTGDASEPLSAEDEPRVVAAQPAPATEASVPVSVTGADDAETKVALYPEWAARGSLPPVAHCTLPCELQMPRGPYRLEVAESPSMAGGSRPVVIDGPSKLVVSPRDRGMRTAGLVLGISGIASIVGGFALIADGLRPRCFGDVCSSRSSPEAAVGLTALLAGAALTPIGWVIFGKSFHPGVEVEHPETATTPRARVGIVPLRGGAGLGGSFVL